MSDEPATPPGSRRGLWTWIIVGALSLIFLGGLAVPGHGPQRLGYRLQSWHQMGNIALSLKAYQRQHNGKLPVRFAELVSEDLDESRRFYFSSRYTTSVRPKDIDSPDLIDRFTPYGFGQLPDGNPYVHERPGMWDDGTVGYMILGAYDQPPDDWRSYRVTAAEFERLVRENFAKPARAARTAP